MRLTTLLGTSAVALAAVVLATSALKALDDTLPAYHPVSSLSGRLKSVGSDTLGHEMALWAAAFEKLYPDVKIDVEATGSATAPKALTDGMSQFGPMSRPMTIEETSAFEGKYGYKVSSFRVAVDALAVYVNKDNPVPCLTLPLLSGIFSLNRKAPGSANIRTWGDLGLTGDWAAQPIMLYSRNTLSGTYEYFRKPRSTAEITNPRSNRSPVPRRSCKAWRPTNSRSVIPASALRPPPYAPCRLLPITARNATRLRPKRRLPANIRSRGIFMFISTKNPTNRSIRCERSSSNTSCPKTARSRPSVAVFTRSPMKSATSS